MENATPTPIIGKRRENIHLEDMTAGDPWGDAPFYTAGESSSDTLIGVPQGSMVCGIYHGLRQSKVGKKSHYGVFETTDGEKFRMFTPGQLRWTLENRCKVNDYVEIIYNGKEFIEELDEKVHAFTVNVGRDKQ